MSFYKKKFYSLLDIKKFIVNFPPIFILLFALSSSVILYFILEARFYTSIEVIEQKNRFYKDKLLNDYIRQLSDYVNVSFNEEENHLRKINSEIKGYLKALDETKQYNLGYLLEHLKSIEQKRKIQFILYDNKSYNVLYGKDMMQYLQNLTPSKIIKPSFEKYILKNIYKIDEENFQYWVDKENSTLQLSYFDDLKLQNLSLGTFFIGNDIKIKTKRMIFETITQKSKSINGYLWFYDYKNDVVYNYFNESKIYTVSEILALKPNDNEISLLYGQSKANKEHSNIKIHDFKKFDFLIGIKTNYLKTILHQAKVDYHNQLVYSILLIVLITLFMIVIFSFFTGFVNRIITRYNRRLEFRHNMYKRAKERYELAIIASNDGLWDIDFEDNKVYFSQKWLQMFGYDKNDISSFQDWLKLVHPDDQEKIEQKINNHYKEQSEHLICEYRIRTKQGHYKWILVRGKLFKNASGNKDRMLMMSMDIDNRKKMTQELRDVELLVEVGRIVIFKWKRDSELSVDFVSKSINSYGYSKEDFEKQKIKYYDFVYEEDRQKFKDIIESAIIKNLSSFSISHRIVESNGGIKWVYNRTILLKDHFGNVTHLYGYINDITQMKMNEEELKLRVSYEVKKNIEKDRLLIHQSKLASMGEMLGSIAHQWRQPLNNISLLIHFIRDNFSNKSFLQKDMNETIDSIKLQIDYMSQTIDDFRDFYKPTKDKNEFFLKTMIANASKIVATQFEREDILLEVSGENVKLFTYENELQQVIVNILNNAKDAAIEKKAKVNFLPKVHINIRKVSQNVIIDLSNNCGTVSNKVLSRMFEPYFTTKFETQGTGIGLYMSKTIIENNMKGKIGAKIIENGLNFSIILPI